MMHGNTKLKTSSGIQQYWLTIPDAVCTVLCS